MSTYSTDENIIKIVGTVFYNDNSIKNNDLTKLTNYNNEIIKTFTELKSESDIIKNLILDQIIKYITLVINKKANKSTDFETYNYVYNDTLIDKVKSINEFIDYVIQLNNIESSNQHAKELKIQYFTIIKNTIDENINIITKKKTNNDTDTEVKQYIDDIFGTDTEIDTEVNRHVNDIFINNKYIMKQKYLKYKQKYLKLKNIL
jgi:hypothetical protein